MVKSKIDTKDIVKAAKNTKIKRRRMTFTLDDAICVKFAEKCEKEDVAMSRVLEELMLRFIE